MEKLQTGGVGVLPLAPLADDAAVQLPAVLETIDRRLADEVEADEADKLRAATSMLMGLRHPPNLIHELLNGMWQMWENVLEDSSIIKQLVERGEQRGEQRVTVKFRDALLRLGEKRLGPPDPSSRAAIERIVDPDLLATLSDRILEVASWQELLASCRRPAPLQRPRQRVRRRCGGMRAPPLTADCVRVDGALSFRA